MQCQRIQNPHCVCRSLQRPSMLNEITKGILLWSVDIAVRVDSLMVASMPKFVVVDVETTGFGRYDRLVEIAAVTLDPKTLETIEEYDTLINPERDVGPTGVHGITAAMVEAAPTFTEIIAAVAGRLQGAVLIAHNLAFDKRMLLQEFDRGGVAIDPGDGLCTYRATKKKLCLACDEHNIPLTCHHRALADAQATAELARRLRFTNRASSARAVKVGAVSHGSNPFTLRRGLADAGTSPMHRIVSRASYPDCDSVIQQYLDMLDWVLDDGVITERENLEIRQLACDLNISEESRREAHRAYLDCIISAAKRDGVISVAEHKLIVRIADQLEVEDPDIPDVSPVVEVESFQPGSRVCFTGTPNKAQLENFAQSAGMTPVRSVTKKGCDVLVAADAATSSSKARKAKKWGIPIISAKEFIERLEDQ